MSDMAAYLNLSLDEINHNRSHNKTDPEVNKNHPVDCNRVVLEVLLVRLSSQECWNIHWINAGLAHCCNGRITSSTCTHHRWLIYLY